MAIDKALLNMITKWLHYDESLYYVRTKHLMRMTGSLTFKNPKALISLFFKPLVDLHKAGSKGFAGSIRYL